MKESEKIPVYIRAVRGVTVCVCHADNKRCKRECEPTMVTRERYEGWRLTMKRDKYGK